MIAPPFNFRKWIDDNKEFLKPPVGNKRLFKTDGYFIMVVGGPNERADFHYQPTEELFYQVKGSVFLRVIDEGKFRCIEIKEGDFFMLPPYTPHSPFRPADTVGLVLERYRDVPDEMHFCCPNTSAHGNEPYLIHVMKFNSYKLFEELPVRLKEWQTNDELRICKKCGYKAAPLESPCQVPFVK